MSVDVDVGCARRVSASEAVSDSKPRACPCGSGEERTSMLDDLCESAVLCGEQRRRNEMGGRRWRCDASSGEHIAVGDYLSMD